MWKRKSDKRRFYLREGIKNAKYWSAKIQNWFGDFLWKAFVWMQGTLLHKFVFHSYFTRFSNPNLWSIGTDNRFVSCEYNVSNVSSVSMRGFLILKLFCSVDMYLKGITECDLIGRSVSLTTNCNFCLKRIHVILKIDFHQRFITKL